MKLFLLSFLGSIAATNAISGADLLKKWDLTEPIISYDGEANTFVLTYEDSSSLVGTTGVKSSMYDYGCKEGGTIVNDGITLAFDGFDGLDAIVSLKVDTKIITANPSVYFVIDEDLRTKSAPGSTSPLYEGLTSADDDMGLVALCLRYSIGTAGDTEADFYEVNFLETLIQIKYDLTAGFSVDGIAVAPKERSITTQAKDAYNLIAYLCDGISVVEDGGRQNPVLSSSTFNQGALVSVCVIPDPIAVADGIFIDSIIDYFWIRYENVPGPEAPDFPAFDDAGAASDTKQKAIPLLSNENGLSALSYHLGAPGSDNHYVVIQSILFADFYKSAGTVSGIGQATLKFADNSRRMLKGSDGADADTAIEGRRRLQDDAPSTFDVNIGVTNDAEGPGALKTAGGASLGFTAMATAAALVSAALLA